MIEGGINAIHIEFAAYSLNIPDVKTTNVKKIDTLIVNKKNNAVNTTVRIGNNTNRSLIVILHDREYTNVNNLITMPLNKIENGA
jgi:hypothetical protein